MYIFDIGQTDIPSHLAEVLNIDDGYGTLMEIDYLGDSDQVIAFRRPKDQTNIKIKYVHPQ